MKKLLSSVVIACILLMTVGSVCYAATFQPILSVEDGVVGRAVTVSVSLPADTNAAGGSFNLVYDNTKMDLVSISEGDVVSTCYAEVNQNYAVNKIRMTFASDEALSADGGEVLRAIFQLTAEGAAEFYTEKFKLADVNGNYVSCADSADYITITSASSTSVPVTGVSLNKTATVLNIGETEALVATVAPSNASDKSLLWSTSNPNVATVTNGVVTAMGAGDAVITVTTADGGKVAKCNVTVNDDTTEYDVVIKTKAATKKAIIGKTFTYDVYMSGTYDGYSFEIPGYANMEITDVSVANSKINADMQSNGKWLVSVLGGLEKTDSEEERIVTVTVNVLPSAEPYDLSLVLDGIAVSNEIGDKVEAIQKVFDLITVTDRIPGDINGDGNFDYFDVSKLYAFYRGKATLGEDVDTDINGDGDFNYFDVSKLYAIYRGKASF